MADETIRNNLPTLAINKDTDLEVEIIVDTEEVADVILQLEDAIKALPAKITAGFIFALETVQPFIETSVDAINASFDFFKRLIPEEQDVTWTSDTKDFMKSIFPPLTFWKRFSKSITIGLANVGFVLGIILAPILLLLAPLFAIFKFNKFRDALRDRREKRARVDIQDRQRTNFDVMIDLLGVNLEMLELQKATVSKRKRKAAEDAAEEELDPQFKEDRKIQLPKKGIFAKLIGSLFAGVSGFFGLLTRQFLGIDIRTIARPLISGFIKVAKKAIIRMFPLALIAAAIGTFIFGAFETFFSSEKDSLIGKISEAIIGGLGQLLEFFTFGLLDQAEVLDFFEPVLAFLDNAGVTIENALKSLINGIIEFAAFTVERLTFGRFGGGIRDFKLDLTKRRDDVEEELEVQTAEPIVVPTPDLMLEDDQVQVPPPDIVLEDDQIQVPDVTGALADLFISAKDKLSEILEPVNANMGVQDTLALEELRRQNDLAREDKNSLINIAPTNIDASTSSNRQTTIIQAPPSAGVGSLTYGYG